MKRLFLLLAITSITLAQSSHTVTLSCTPSVSGGVSGYNFYRGTITGGPYAKLNTATVATCSYTDSTVQPATTYYYVATAVCLVCLPAESKNSNETAAIVPANPQPNPPTTLTNTVSP